MVLTREARSNFARGLDAESDDAGPRTRYVWESRYGPILIEVIGNEVYVNGQRVERSVKHLDDPDDRSHALG